MCAREEADGDFADGQYFAQTADDEAAIVVVKEARVVDE